MSTDISEAMTSNVQALPDDELEKELSFAIGFHVPGEAEPAADMWLAVVKAEATKRGLWAESGTRCHTCRHFIEEIEGVWTETRQCPDKDICFKALHYRHRPVEDPA